MYSKVLVFLSGLVQILGRPTAEMDYSKDGSYVQTPLWPLEKNVFLMPTLLNVDDMINMTIDITKYAPDEIVFDFTAEDYNSKNAIICSIRADMKSRMVTVLNENDEAVVDEQIDYFFLDDEKLLLNMWIKRRDNRDTDENNFLEVNTISSAFKPFKINNIDKIRYLKFRGDNAKIISLDFKFA